MDKFTIPADKQLIVEMHEKSGGRHQEFVIENSDIERALQIPKAQFTAEGGYYYMFLSNYSKSLFFSIGGSALLGYEMSNWGDKVHS